MNINELSAMLDSHQGQPPLDSWHPKSCGEMNLVIKANGEWWHQNTKINRQKLISLFANVLVKEGPDYYLKTPVEKIKITVEDAPFIITEWRHIETDQGLAIEVTSNLKHRVVICENHTVTQQPGSSMLYIELFRGLKAKIHRNIYYQWAEFGREKLIDNQPHLILRSGDYEFSLGEI